MPGVTMSAAIREAYASAPASVVVLHTLELRHPSFRDASGAPTAIRVVRDMADLTATLETTAPLNAGEAVTFTGLAFEFSLPPEDDRGSAPEIQITLDNASAELMRYLDGAVDTNEPIEITYRPYLSTDTSAPHIDPPLTMTLRDIEANLTQVTARASFADVANRRFPAATYTAARFPGLAAR